MKLSLLIAATLSLSPVGDAVAAETQSEAVLAALLKEQTNLLTRLPALIYIDSAIRSDCAARNEANPAESGFCRCASSITMSLWRSGADANMVARLQEFLREPSELGALAFLNYQGPEMYGPICAKLTEEENSQR